MRTNVTVWSKTTNDQNLHNKNQRGGLDRVKLKKD